MLGFLLRVRLEVYGSCGVVVVSVAVAADVAVDGRGGGGRGGTTTKLLSKLTAGSKSGGGGGGGGGGRGVALSLYACLSSA